MIRSYWLHYVKTRRHPQNPNTLHISLSSVEDRATTTGNMSGYFVKFGRVVVEICERTERQTDKHRNMVGCVAQW